MTAVAPAWDDVADVPDEFGVKEDVADQLDDTDERADETIPDEGIIPVSPHLRPGVSPTAGYEERNIRKYLTYSETPASLKPIFKFANTWESTLSLLPRFPLFYERESRIQMLLKFCLYLVVTLGGIITSVWATTVVFPGVWTASLALVLLYLRNMMVYFSALRIVVSLSHSNKLAHTIQLTMRTAEQISAIEKYLTETARKNRVLSLPLDGVLCFLLGYSVVWDALVKSNASTSWRIAVMFFNVTSYFSITLFTLSASIWPSLPLMATANFAGGLKRAMRDRKMTLEQFVEHYRVLQSVTEHATMLGGPVMGSIWICSTLLVLVAGVAALTTVKLSPLLIFLAVTSGLAVILTPLSAARFNSLTSNLTRTIGLLYGDACADLEGRELAEKTDEIARILQYMQAAKVNFVVLGIRITPSVITTGLSTVFSLLAVIFKVAADSRGTGFTI